MVPHEELGKFRLPKGITIRVVFKDLSERVRVAVYLNGSKRYESEEDQSQYNLEFTLEEGTTLLWFVIPVKRTEPFRFRVIIQASEKEEGNWEVTKAAGLNAIQSVVLIPEESVQEGGELVCRANCGW